MTFKDIKDMRINNKDVISVYLNGTKIWDRTDKDN